MKELVPVSAGFLQGEGSFGVYHYLKPDWRTKKKYPYSQPQISAYNNDRAPLKQLVKLFGGCISINHKKGTVTNAGHCSKDGLHWIVTHRHALTAAEAVYPFLVGRAKDRCSEIIQYYREKDKRLN